MIWTTGLAMPLPRNNAVIHSQKSGRRQGSTQERPAYSERIRDVFQHLTDLLLGFESIVHAELHADGIELGFQQSTRYCHGNRKLPRKPVEVSPASISGTYQYGYLLRNNLVHRDAAGNSTAFWNFVYAH